MDHSDMIPNTKLFNVVKHKFEPFRFVAQHQNIKCGETIGRCNLIRKTYFQLNGFK